MTDANDLYSFADMHKLDAGAARRAAISRAYYAAFHALQAAVDPMIAVGERGRHGCANHGAVLSALRNWGAKHPDAKKAMAFGAEASKCFHLMRACLDERERADYEMGPAGELDAADSVAIVGKARRLMQFAAKA